MSKWEVIKSELVKNCTSIIEHRISNALEMLKTSNESAHLETKSSAGDKYETARAMAHLEYEKAALQLNEALKLKQVLAHVNFKSSGNQVFSGSLVITDHYHFLLAISLNKMTVAGHDFFVVSPTTPVGRLIMGKMVGAQFSFNNQVHTVQEII